MQTARQKRLLIVSTTGMGDSLWATPGLRALKKSFPGLRTDFLVDERWLPLFLNNPNIDRILIYKKQWFRQLGLIFKLWREIYDHVLVFHANKDIRRILAGVRCDNIWTHQSFGWIAEAHRVVLPRPTHSIRRRLILVERIGGMTDGGGMELYFSADEQAAAERRLGELDLRAGEFVYLNIGASLQTKRWPEKRWIELGAKILAQTSLQIALGAGPGEEALVETVARGLGMNRVASALGGGVRENALLIGKARAMVTSDTGPMHLAFVQNVPTVALFGVTDPRESGPYELPPGACSAIVSAANPWIYPNAAHGEDNPFERIGVEEVWKAFAAAIGGQ